MYKTPLLNLNPEKLEEYKKKLVVLHTIKKEYVDTTYAGRVRFGISPLAKMARKKIVKTDYDITGKFVSLLVNSAMLGKRRVFRRERTSVPRYSCDPDDFTSFYKSLREEYVGMIRLSLKERLESLFII